VAMNAGGKKALKWGTTIDNHSTPCIARATTTRDDCEP
jgi:hypothetical protein